MNLMTENECWHFKCLFRVDRGYGLKCFLFRNMLKIYNFLIF